MLVPKRPWEVTVCKNCVSVTVVESGTPPESVMAFERLSYSTNAEWERSLAALRHAVDCANEIWD
jgi:hypothetical protein